VGRGSGDGRAATVLVTGSAGGIGQHVVERLRAGGQQVRGLDVLGPHPGAADPGAADEAATGGPVGASTAVSAAGDQHTGDLRDLDVVRRAVLGVDAIVHAGAIPHDAGDGSAVMATNVLGTWNVLQAAAEAGVTRVVSFSSVNALGSVGGWQPTVRLPIDDGYPPHPATPYQLSKHLGEEICRSFSERHGMVTLCLRPVWVTAPGRYADPAFGSEAFLAEWRDEFWAYVDLRDVGDAVVRCLALEGVRHDRFLLAAADTSVDVPTAELVDRHHASIPWPRHARAAWLADDPYRSLIDCSHAERVLGWRPAHSWRDAPAGATNESEA